MSNRANNRSRGFALPAAVFGLVVVGVLVTGGFYVARQESRIGVANEHAAKALYIAERGVSEVVTGFSSTGITSMPVWGDTVLADTLNDGIWEVDVTRLNQRSYFLDGTGTVTLGGLILGGASRRVGMIAKVYTAVINPLAALTTQGDLKIGGSSQINGYDSIPPGWPGLCDPATLSDHPGILIDDTTNISTSGNAYDVSGTPPASEDPSLNAETLLSFGDVDWDQLVKLASVKFTTSETITNTMPDSLLIDGSWICGTGKYNWGDPLNPGSVCGNRFPIIYAAQSLNINSNASGQGILLVEDDLRMQGGYTFYGPVIVKGTLSTAGTGGHVNGGVIAANVDLDSSTVLGDALVQFSSCAVTRAVLNNSDLTRMVPIAERSWVDLSNVMN